MQLPRVVEAVLESGAVLATKYLSPTLTVRAKRRTYKRVTRKAVNEPVDIHLHIGKPNYAERQRIKKFGPDQKYPIGGLDLKHSTR